MRVALLLLLLAASVLAQDAPTFTRHVSDGIYTAEQARLGQSVYTSYCAYCHGPELQGRTDFPAGPNPPVGRWRAGSPALKGDTFIANWTDLPVARLFERIRISMPQDAPGSLTRRQNAQVLAFILQQNGFRAGAADLAETEAAMSSIRMDR